MSLTGFHPFWDKNILQNLQAVANQGCHLEGSSPYRGIAGREVYCTFKLNDFLADSGRFFIAQFPATAQILAPIRPLMNFYYGE
jgi:hypothetical protein